MPTSHYRTYSLLTGLAVIAALSSPASAAAPSGRLLASQCSQCHGTNGHAVSGFRTLAGRKGLYSQLLQIKARTADSIMSFQAKGYTDEQLRLIADYYATQ